MPIAVPRYLSAASSDVGSVRPNNEDRVYCDEARGFFLVIDGMGGHEAGEQAAEIALQRIRSRLERQTGDAEQRLREAIALANNAVYQSSLEQPEWMGMACVLTIALIEEGQVIVGHVGDSRLYRMKRDTIEKITRDHSPVGEREDSGELTEWEAMRHPRRNEVYRDVGSEEHAPDDENFIEIFRFPFEPDSAFLLCSDGLSDAISSQRILQIVEENAGDRWAATRALISAANEVGKDNVSIVIVEGETFAASLKSKTETTPAPVPWYRSRWAFLFYGALLGAALTFSVQMFMMPVKPNRTAQLLRVTSPSTISDALEKAQAGDTVEVGPGTYEESVQLKEGVALIANPAHEAVIAGSVSAEDLGSARLEGFQIRGSDGGVHIRKSSVLLSRNDIAQSQGVGVEFSGNARGAIFACFIHNNAGSGIVVADTAAPAIENNLIIDNGVGASSPRPGLSIRSSSPLIFSGNTFAGNGAEAIWLPVAEESAIQRNFFLPSSNGIERPRFRIVPLGEGRP
ncbi:MAG: right-handed parallel beta-helix repeat-containing protein [Acidobacteriaceae bacterium]|nr:right-handed parallel beta-helix repeat-containing protein [Acidobacteriaceae bacterium]